MNCERFERWLDEGCDERAGTQARAHVRGCPRCASAFEAALELEVAMGAAPLAPAGFTDRVMALVAASPQPAADAGFAPVPAPVRALAELSTLPWWVRAAMEPATLLAAAVAALLLGLGGSLFQGASLVGGWLSHALTTAPPLFAPLTQDSRVMMVVALALAPSVAWASARLYAWGKTQAG